MPSGLPEVTQPVGADASRYIAEYRKAYEETVKLSRANEELLAAINEVRKAAGGLTDKRITISADVDGALASIARVKAELAGLGDKEITVAVRYVTGGGGPADAEAAIQAARQVVAPAGMSDAVRQISQFADAQQEAAQAAAETALGAAAARDAIGKLAAGENEASLSSLRQIDALARARDGLDRYVAGMQNAAAVQQMLSDGVTLQSAALKRQVADWSAAANAAQVLTGDQGAAPLVLPAGGGGGGGSAFWNFALQRGGGGGKFGALMAMGAGDIARGMTALGAVWPIVHWTFMGLAELAAVGVPAAIAAGAAGYVGLQGGMNVLNRAQAGYAVTEALGGAYGVTGGQIYGLGTSIQKAQNLADPLVYQAVGGILNGINGLNKAVSAAGGQSFAQMGTGVLQTMDQFIAKMVTEVSSNKVGKQMAQLGSVATTDLTEFGQVFGNLGHFVVNAASNMPGLSEWLLKGLTGITGFMSDVAGLGVPFTVALGTEEAWRWGGAIGALLGKATGGIGSLLGSLGGGLAGAAEGGVGGGGLLTGLLGGLGGLLGTRGASAADRQALAKALGVGVGDLTAADLAGIGGAGTGLAGLLGGAADLLTGPLGWLAIGGTVAAGIGIDKLIRAQTPVQQTTSQWAAALTAPGPVASLGLIPGQLAAARAQQAQAQAAEAQAQAAIAGKVPGVSPYAAFGTAAYAQQNLSGYAAYEKQLAQYTAGIAQSGVQISKTFGVDIPEALTLFQETGIKYPAKGGLLGAKQLGQIADTVRGYEAMTAGQGALGASINAVSAASALQNTQVSTLNSSLDTLSQNAAGGTSSFTAMQGALQGMAPATAKALEGFTSPAAVTAWQAFSGQGGTPSFLSTAQATTDWIRTMMASQAVTGGPAAEMAAYTAKQGFAVAAQSPVALAQLATLIQPFGGPAYDAKGASETLKQNAAAISQWLDKTAGSSAQFASNFEKTSIAGSNIGQIASNLTQNLQQAAASGFAQSFATQITTATDALDKSIGKGGTLSRASYPAITQLGEELKNAGFQAGDIKTFLGEALSLKGLDPAQVSAAISGLPKSVKIALGFDVTAPKMPKFEPITEKFTPAPAPAPPKGGTIEYDSHVHPPAAPPAPHGYTVEYPSRVQTPVAPPAPKGGVVVYSSVVEPPAGVPGAAAVGTGGARYILGQRGFKVPGWGGGDIHPALLEGGEAVVPKHLVPHIAPFLSANRVPGFQAGGLASPSVPYFPGLDVMTRVAIQDVAQELISDLQQAVSAIAGSIRPAPGGGGPLQPSGGGSPAPKGTATAPVAVHVTSVAPAAAATIASAGGALPGGGLPFDAKAQKVLDKFEETFASMGSPWGKFASQILQGLLGAVKDPMKETAAQAQKLVNQVSQEVTYGQGVAAAAKQGTGYSPWGGAQTLLSTFTGLPTPTTTAGGAPYQYYTDQATIAGGGTVSVQQQMGDYLQAMQSFQGDLSRLTKARLNKNLMQQLIAAGPVQGDVEAQSILSGPGGAAAANRLWSQINKSANALGISSAQDVYGAPQQLKGAIASIAGKTVKVGATADLSGVNALKGAISSLQGRTVTIKVNIDTGGSGGGGGGGKTGDLLPKSTIDNITRQIQASLLQQAKRNRRTGVTLPGYGS